MISAVATALGAATVAITLMSGGFTEAETASASGTLIDAQIVEVYVFLLAAFTGFQIITKVPPLLHTPLMAATNAISAISLVASLDIAGAERPFYITVMGAVAVAYWLVVDCNISRTSPTRTCSYCFRASRQGANGSNS